MICGKCKDQEHGKCEDLPRLTAARKGQIAGMTDPMASRWCDCGHVILTDLALIGVKEVIE